MEQPTIDLFRRVADLERRLEGLIKPEVPLWVDWTPTVTQSVSVTVTVTSARYATDGQTATVQAVLDVTGSGTAGNAIVISGQPAAIQPANSGNGNYVIGTMIVLNSGTAFYHGALVAIAATDWRGIVHGNIAAIGAAPSFGLASGDRIGIVATFERA